MDTLAYRGASFFCGAAHHLGANALEMATCGSTDGRYATGLATSAAVILLGILVAWRVAAMRR